MISANSPASRSWTFSDGTSSTEQNPTHTYETTGTYDVSRTVSDGVTVSMGGSAVSGTAEERGIGTGFLLSIEWH